MEPVRKVDVALISEGEMPACVEVLSKSFGHDAPFVDIYFPDHDTPFGQAKASERLEAWRQSSESSTFLKAVLRADGASQERIIGIAVWTLMKEPPPPELSKVEDVEEVWPDEDDREFMTRLWREYVIPRTQSIKDSEGKGVYGMWHSMLELLAVHPDYQRRGAGRALVEWGTKAADEQGIKVRDNITVFHFCSQILSVVEGTPIGRKLYEQCGLSAEIEEMRFDVGEEYIGRRKPELVFLTREPRT